MNPIILLLVVLIIISVLGLGPWHSYSAGWGYLPSGGVGLILLILLVVLITRG